MPYALRLSYILTFLLSLTSCRSNSEKNLPASIDSVFTRAEKIILPEINRIAFGSCNNEDRPQTHWEVILQSRPDVWIWMGDNVYADTESKRTMKAAYAKVKSHKAYQKLVKSCPVIGTWDDHDYGANDAGMEYPKKEKSQKLLLDFLNEPEDSPRRKQKGVYTSYLFGDTGRQVKIILLDTRYFKETPGTESDILGETQWRWLEGELTNSSADLQLIVSSIMLIPGEQDSESWSEFPKSRERFFALLGKTKAKGVIILSGDRHYGDLSVMENSPAGYPVYEVLSSGLTHYRESDKVSLNRYRVKDNYIGMNFGLIKIDWESRIIR